MLTTTSDKFILSPPLFEEKWLNFFICKKEEELENFHCVTFFWACTRTSCWEEAEASFCQKCFVSSWRQRRREDSRLLCHRTEKKVKSTSFLKLCKTQKRYYIYIMILARNVSHFIFPGLHTMYVLLGVILHKWRGRIKSMILIYINLIGHLRESKFSKNWQRNKWTTLYS